MKEKIGVTAGKIWNTLNTEDEISLTRLPKMVGERETVVYQALGWLAREDKVEYEQKGNRTLVSIR
ncbi:MAG: winged helix-turn-helix domain-containing protein [candidate division Zixibacteria bacterium]|nr:winged helix-turn-helix domain-containing protein [candidate division Zixibacteria bacterium]